MNELLVSKLKDARISKGLKQQEVAEQLGLKANTISNWEKGKTEPDIDTFVKLCDIYQIDCASLLSDVYAFKRIKSDISLSEYEHIKKYRSLDQHGQETVQIVLDRELERTKIVQQQTERIAELETKPNNTSDAGMHPYPYLHRIACAGTSFAFEDIPTEQKLVPYMPGADFVIGVLGDSMEPTFFDGELVYVRKTDHIRHGDIGIFTLGNEWYIKECGEFGLLSHNPDYDDIPGSEYIRVVGEVLGKVPDEYV